MPWSITFWGQLLFKYRRSVKGIAEEWCLTSFTVSERENGVPKTAVMMIRSIDALMKEEEQQRQKRMVQTLANMSDGFFVYSAAEDERLLYANPVVLKIFGCSTMEEFTDLVDNSFRGMVHPEDRNRIECQIQEQIEHSDKKMDHILYRIIRRDREIRWIDDWGHLVDSGMGADNQLFYVFIQDITESMKEQQKERLLHLNRCYQE